MTGWELDQTAAALVELGRRRDAAELLRADGRTYREIGVVVYADPSVVYRWLMDPAKRERERERDLARRDARRHPGPTLS